MQKFIEKFLTTVPSILLAGCASISDLQHNVDSRDSCCTSIAEFKYEPIFPGKQSSFSLGEASPVFKFDTGKSYFKAFSLPSALLASRLRVISQPTGSVAFETEKFSQSFCAEVLFADESFKIIAQVRDIPTYVRGFWSSAFMSDFEVPESTRYVVLYTAPRLGSSALRYTRGGAYLVGNSIVVEAGGEEIRHPCGPVAQAAVELIPTK